MNSSGNSLKLALVTDIHQGAPTKTKHGDKALLLLNQFVEFVNKREINLVVDLGDRISDIDAETDRSLTAQVASAFQRIIVPHYHLAGNHDLEHMTRAECEKLL